MIIIIIIIINEGKGEGRSGNVRSWMFGRRSKEQGLLSKSVHTTYTIDIFSALEPRRQPSTTGFVLHIRGLFPVPWG